jgi:hypothetical protein
MTTITVPRAVLEQALGAMDKATRFMSDSDYVRLNQVIDALRAALAQQEQEPVAWRDPATDDIVSVARRAAWETDYGLGGKDRAATYTEPLYARPPRREWQRAALAQQEQEQDAEAWVDKGSIAWLGEQRSLQRRKVRSRREWQSLSEEEIEVIEWHGSPFQFTRAVEAKLKEKNA